METVPFRTFGGFLKQYSHESLSALEQELFDLLFPAFQGTPDAEESYEAAIKNPLVSTLAPLIELVPGERRPRRFSGFDLPRKRYFSVCVNASGNDSQTLAHELRAYRNPIDVGMVEVFDLAEGCNLSIREATVRLEPQLVIAVLIHEPQALPSKFDVLPFQRIAGLKDYPIFVYRFPYRVSHCTIEQAIDLRFPRVQDWFYRTFRDLSATSGARLAPAIGPDSSPTTARSRFTFENGLAPVPDNFWSMLPTLMNPDLGGGNPADTGSTLFMIGHWMRQNAAALIFPSARCDTAAVFQDGVLDNWQGWNLVDFRQSHMFGLPKAHILTFVLSPWAWVSLPSGVRLHMADKDSRIAGSFAIENMVDYWAQDYLGQVKALEIARSAHGREKSRDTRSTLSDELAYRVFQIGALPIRWVRMAVQGSPVEQIESTVLELQGLGLPYDMYSITGRVLELWSDVKRGATTINDVMLPALTTNDLLFRFLEHRYPQGDLDKLAMVGADLELILFFLAARARTGATAKDASFDPSGLLNEANNILATSWLDESLKGRIREYQEKALHEVRSGGAGTARCLEDGVQLEKAISEHLRTRDNNRRALEQ